MRVAMAALAVSGALGLGAAAPGAALASQAFNFSGQCSDCIGNGVGVLTLSDTANGMLNTPDFVDFIYRSSLLSFEITSADPVTLTGVIDPADASRTFISIIQTGGAGWGFMLNRDGSWLVSSDITGGQGGPAGGGAVVQPDVVGSFGGDDTEVLIPLVFRSKDSRVVDDFGSSSDLTPLPVGTGNEGAVPEPATWAMMLLGFASLGAMMRSTRRNLELEQAGIETA